MSSPSTLLCRSWWSIGLTRASSIACCGSGTTEGLSQRLLHSSPSSFAAVPRRVQSSPDIRQPVPGPAASSSDAAAQAFLRSRWPYIAGIGFAAAGALAYSVFREPTVTQQVYLDFEVDGVPAGRVVVGLYGKEAPQTCENFAALADHARGFGYRGCPVHRLMPGWSVWSGDVTAGDGSGGVSVFGPSFGVETMGVRHRRGTLSMVLDEEGRLRSQFFFTLVTTPGLDRKAAAFGKVLEGLEVLDRLSRLPTERGGGGGGAGGKDGEEQGDGRPLADVRLRDCGVLRA